MLNYQKQFPGDPIYMPAQTRTQSSTEEDSNTLVVVVPAWGVLCARPVALRVLRRDNEQGRDRRAATAVADRQQDRTGLSQSMVDRICGPRSNYGNFPFLRRATISNLSHGTHHTIHCKRFCTELIIIISDRRRNIMHWFYFSSRAS